MTSVVVSFSNKIRLNISKSKTLTKILLKKLLKNHSVILTRLHNAIDKSWEKTISMSLFCVCVLNEMTCALCTSAFYLSLKWHVIKVEIESVTILWHFTRCGIISKD